MRIFFLVLILALSFSQQTYAQDASPIILDVAEEQVSITAGFDGVRIVVFGVAAPQDHLAITIKGPAQNIVVRRKMNVMGLWVNAASQEFRTIPSYYGYAVSTPDLKSYVGLDSLDLRGAESVSPLRRREFQDALIRNLQAENLYAVDAIPIMRQGGNLFRTEFQLPNNTPIGPYTLEAIVFRDGNIIGRTQRIMRVVQTGMTGRIQTFATDYSFAYALSALIIAVMAGLGSFFLSRREI
jgi:uncharacterized protein (TIGR02186 family)